MALKYTFPRTFDKAKQDNWMSWHVINIEQDVHPVSVKRISDRAFVVKYDADGMTEKELDAWILKKVKRIQSFVKIARVM